MDAREMLLKHLKNLTDMSDRIADNAEYDDAVKAKPLCDLANSAASIVHEIQINGFLNLENTNVK